MCDEFNIIVEQLDLHPADVSPELARIDKQHFARTSDLLFSEEPQTGRDLGVEKQLAGQRDHHVYYIGFDHGTTNIAFAVLAGVHRTVGQDDAGAAVGPEVIEHVLQPGIVGITRRWAAVNPARVTFEAAVPPVADVERWVSQHKVSTQVAVLVTNKSIRRLAAEVEVDAADSQVHGRQTPGGRVGFLTIDRYIAELAAVGLDEFLRLNKHAPRAAAGVVDFAIVRVKYGHQGFDDAARSVELPAALAFGAGKLAKEVFIDLA
ncbi:hypothetical protein D3C84_780400 [compost metagenome]